MSTTAVIPIKQLENAKQRLAGILNDEERTGLFQAMVEDVLTAVEACVSIDEILVVTDDQTVTELAQSYGARVLGEPDERGLIQAVTYASGWLTEAGVNTMVFLPGDVPLVTAEELEVVLDGFGLKGEPEFMIVPAHDLGGSNCVVCSPPNAMEFGFGEDSFRRHLGIARKLGIEPSVARLPGIGLDVDTPEDLGRLVEIVMNSESQSHTGKFFLATDIMERLEPTSEKTG